MEENKLRKIVNSVYECQHGVGSQEADRVLRDSLSESKDELIGKLVMVAGEYMVEVENLRNTIRDKDKTINQWREYTAQLRHQQIHDYKEDMALRRRSGLQSASKGVLPETVAGLIALVKTQNEVAKQLGISRSTVNRYLSKYKEKNVIEPKVEYKYTLKGLER